MTRSIDAASWTGLWAGIFLSLATAIFMVLLSRGRRMRGGVLGFPAVALVLLWSIYAAVRSGAQIPPTMLVLAACVAFVLFGRLLVLAMFERSTKIEGRTPKIVRDFVQVVLLLCVVLWGLHRLGVDASTLVATSTLLTAVIGLSLQDTLGNLFAGLALQMQRPFVVGDWVAFDDDPRHVGRVTEVNWRATSFVTLDDVLVVMPNAQLARAPITNFTQPQNVSRRSVYVVVSKHTAPHAVQSTIAAALRGSFGVLADPPVSVVTHRFVPESGIEYWVRFYTDRFELRDRVDGEARDRIWYAFRRSGLELPSQQASLYMHEVNEEVRTREERARLERVTNALRNMSLFGELSAGALSDLALQSQLRPYVAGEVIVREGEQGSELFLIERGEARVTIQRAKKTVELARLGPGMFFGERSAMTGEPRRASIVALTDCEVVAVGSVALRQLLASEPHVAEHLSEVVAAREADLSLGAPPESVQLATKEDRRQEVLRRIRHLFSE